jgi:hypothetical protein
MRTLRRELKRLSDPTKADRNASDAQIAKDWCDLWLKKHPDKTAKDYQSLSGEEKWDWQVAMGRAATAAERKAWERDHPGEDYPEHPCSLTSREATDLQRWRRQRERRGA